MPHECHPERSEGVVYRPLNQYHVMMEVDPRYSQNPDALNNIYVRSTNNTIVPLGSFAKFEQSNTALGVNHQGYGQV
jgi:multidrug efflux pump